MAAFYRWTRDGNSEALTHFQRAIELDPNFASAYGMAARCYAQRKARGWIADQARETAETARLAKRAVELGKDDAVALMAAGFALAYVVGDIEDGAAFIDQALVLNPNLASAWMFSGQLKVWLGQPETAIERLTHAMRLSPQDPQLVHVHRNTAQANFIAGRYVEAFSWAEKAARAIPDNLITDGTVAACAALAGRLADAERAVARLRQLQPQLRISDLMDLFPLRRPEDRARWVEGLRKAGLPE